MKYFKPKSLTWWSGVVMALGGLISVVQSKDYASVLHNPMILGGLATIGFRGAIPPAV